MNWACLKLIKDLSYSKTDKSKTMKTSLVSEYSTKMDNFLYCQMSILNTDWD